MSYKETSSVSDLFPLDKLRLITGCIDLRLKIRRGVCTGRAVPVLGPRAAAVGEVVASAAAGVSQWTSVYLGTLAMRGHSAICTRATNL
jgi:hypothetical protein